VAHVANISHSVCVVLHDVRIQSETQSYVSRLTNVLIVTILTTPSWGALDSEHPDIGSQPTTRCTDRPTGQFTVEEDEASGLAPAFEVGPALTRRTPDPFRRPEEPTHGDDNVGKVVRRL